MGSEYRCAFGLRMSSKKTFSIKKKPDGVGRAHALRTLGRSDDDGGDDEDDVEMEEEAEDEEAEEDEEVLEHSVNSDFNCCVVQSTASASSSTHRMRSLSAVKGWSSSTRNSCVFHWYTVSYTATRSNTWSRSRGTQLSVAFNSKSDSPVGAAMPAASEPSLIERGVGAAAFLIFFRIEVEEIVLRDRGRLLRLKNSSLCRL